jgi:hypothetical protein
MQSAFEVIDGNGQVVALYSGERHCWRVSRSHHGMSDTVDYLGRVMEDGGDSSRRSGERRSTMTVCKLTLLKYPTRKAITSTTSCARICARWIQLKRTTRRMETSSSSG